MRYVALVPDSPPLTLGYVESLLDTRRNEVQVSPTLDRITLLLDVLGNPQRSYPVIMIAGTNGKTSSARMIDALLSRFGLRTGRHPIAIERRQCAGDVETHQPAGVRR